MLLMQVGLTLMKLPPDCKDQDGDELDCPVPEQSNKRNSLFELSTLAYADEGDDEEEEESIILVSISSS